jgi:hypothetical protein
LPPVIEIVANRINLLFVGLCNGEKTAGNVLIRIARNVMPSSMGKTIIQIYEVQNPKEAEALVDLGVDHIGSVLTDSAQLKNATIRKTVRILGTAPYFPIKQVSFCRIMQRQEDSRQYLAQSRPK